MKEISGEGQEKELPAYFRNTRPEVIDLIPASARRVLEIGCAAGEMGRVLREQRPEVEVVGVEVNPQAVQLAGDKLNRAICANVEELEFLPYTEDYFDCIAFGDVLEHLRDPEAVLRKLLFYLQPEGALICSIPNIRHQSVMLELLINGRWQYRDEGLLDRTHIRFFTLFEIRELMSRLGLDLEEVSASQSPPMKEMEPFFRAVAELGGDVETLRRESRIIQYLFRAVRQKSQQTQPIAEGDPRVSVVIPVFNKAEFTEKCLYALAANSGDDPDYEVIVVDNASSDWTIYLLHAFEGDTQVLRNEKNLGFARANNQGATVSRGEYLIFLNNDTLPQPGWLREMVLLADSDAQIGVVGAKLVYPHSGQIQHAGLELQNGIPEHVFRGVDVDDPRVNQVRDLDMVTGACLLIRRQLFEELGGFDSGYLNGVEDVDLCLRVRERGYRVVYCPTSVVEHFEGTSEGRFDKVGENLQRFAEKWQGRFGADGRFIVDAEEILSSREHSQRAASENTPRTFRGNWEGSFFLHSSLAHVNREMVLSLLASGRCELGLIPFEANQFGVEEDPERFGAIAERLEEPLSEAVDFHLRHRWPPDFSRPPAGRLILVQPWEFGRIPQSWVQPLRDGVEQIWAYTEYVRSCYIDSGIEPDRVRVVPLGVDVERFKPGLEPLLLPTEKRFKFLFVGGTLYRKGIDALLEAYRSCFAPDDDVCLVIKDMGTRTFYRDQNAGEQIRALQEAADCAEIVYLTEDLSGDQIPQLYAACDCLVHPYRGEGFGLPVAEAMACGMPVVVTAGGACDDFCSNETAFMIPALRRQVRFQEETVGPAWLLEPDLEILKQQMRQVFGDLSTAKSRGERAAAFVRQHLTWEQTAARALEVLEELCAQEERSSVDIPSPLPDASVRRGTVAVVLGGGEARAVAGLADFLGEEPLCYDVELSAERSLGEQLEEICGDSQGEFLAILGKGTICSAATFARLVETLQSRDDIVAIGPALPGEEGGSGVAVVEFLPLDCILVRRAALEAIGGFDAAFRTTAVFDEVARCCRLRGWQVVRAFDCVLEQKGEVAEDEVATRRERVAVQALEEGDRLKAEEDWEGTEKAYRRALEAKEDFVEVILVLTALLMERGRGAEAVEVVERLVRLDETSYLAHNYLGLAQHQVQNWDAARRSFARALEFEPDYVEALVNLSVLEWGQENADLALDYLERAAELEPDNRDVIVNTGLIYAEVGNVDRALKLFREYVQYHPEDVEVMIFLVDLLMQNDEMEEARQVARRILEIQPQHAKARAIVESSRGQEG